MKIDLQEQFDRAIALLNLKEPSAQDLNTAEGIFNALLNLDMNAPQLLYAIASVQIRKKHFALAMHLLKLVLQIDPKHYFAWNNLGFVYREQQLPTAAKEAFKQAIEIKPDEADFYMNLGGMYVAEGQPDKALELASKALQLDPNNNRAHWNRSLALLEMGDYENGFKEYADCNGEEDERRARQISYGYDVPEYDGSENKIVHVSGEQGIGDEIMFASMIPDLLSKNCKVILEAHPRLYKIFRHSLHSDKVAIYGTRKDKEVAWPLHHKVDAKIQIGSLGKFFRKKKEDFPGAPFLSSSPVLAQKYREILRAMGAKPKIGISWKGGTKKTNMDARTIPLELWLPIFKAIDADFISLQYTDDAEKTIKTFHEQHPDIHIHHWSETLANYDETAGLVSNLDLIISVPQSVVHLAGALGAFTFQLTPKRAMWQMGVYGEDMPWYQSVKNIWQDKEDQWESVMEKMASELKNLQSIISSYQKTIAA